MNPTTKLGYQPAKSKSPASAEAREVIFEYLQIGNALRVTAVDATTGIEVVFQAPGNTNPADLQKMAVRKLKYVLARRKAEK